MVKRSGTYIEDSFEAAGSERAYPLSIGAIYSQQGEAIVRQGEVVRPERSEVEPLRRRELDQRGHEDADAVLQQAGFDPRSREEFYRLGDKGTYIVVFAESPSVPEEGVGIIRPTENLRNAGAVMNASFVESGQSVLRATLLVEDQFTLVEKDAAIAELVVVPAANRQ